MRKIAIALLLVASLLVLTVAPSLAGGKGGRGHGHGHGGWHGPRVRTTVVFGAGPAFFWWYPYPYWYYPPPYYYPPPPPAEPPVYIEQSVQGAPAPTAYWYYCQSAAAYYPNVQSCPEAWIKVAPRSE